MKAKILLIGYGYWGKIWYKTIKSSKHQLVGVVDPIFKTTFSPLSENEITYDSLMNEDGSSVFNVKDDRLDFTHAIVAVPAMQHYKTYKQLKSMGIEDKNILIEKPVGLNLKEATEMSECCHGLVWLYDKAYRNLRYLLKNKIIGDIVLYQSFRASMGPRIRTDVSIIEDYLFHDLYLYLSLTNQFRNTINEDIDINYCNLRKSFFRDHHNLIKPDTVSLSFTDQTRTVEMFSSWIYPKKERKIVIVGTKGSLIWENDSIFINKSYYKKMDNCLSVDKYGNIGYELIEAISVSPEIDKTFTSNLELLLDDFVGNTLEIGDDIIPTSTFKTKQKKLVINTHRLIEKIKNIRD